MSTRVVGNVEDVEDWLPAPNETFTQRMLRRIVDQLSTISADVASIKSKLCSIEIEQMNLSRRLEKIEESPALKKASSSGVFNNVKVVSVESSDEEDVMLQNRSKALDRMIAFCSSKSMNGNLDPVTPSKRLTRGSTSKPSNCTSGSSSYYDYIFTDDRPDEEIISSCNKIYVTRFEMKTLAPLTRIKNVIVDIVSALLTAEERKRTSNKANVWFLPIRISKETLPKSDKKLLEIWKKYKYFQDYMGSLSTCNEIYIPILLGEHYTLARVLVKTRTVEIWDSLASKDDPIQNKTVIKEILSNLDLFLEEEILKLRDARFSFSTFAIKRRSYVPRQGNFVDCGIFVIAFMKDRCSLDYRSLNFDAGMERRKAAEWITTSEHNEVLKGVQSEMIEYGRR